MTTKRLIPMLGLLPVTFLCAATLQEHEQDRAEAWKREAEVFSTCR